MIIKITLRIQVLSVYEQEQTVRRLIGNGTVKPQFR
jgi:hypothetical protein